MAALFLIIHSEDAMKKLKLQADALAVESFTPGDANGQAGTVPANEYFATRPQVCDPLTVAPHC